MGKAAAMMGVTVALFVAGIFMGVAAALVWAWAVRSGQLHDLEKTKHQLFWPDIAPDGESSGPAEPPVERKSA